jgi:hypothetical protein
MDARPDVGITRRRVGGGFMTAAETHTLPEAPTPGGPTKTNDEENDMSTARTMPTTTHEQLTGAYRAMARVARYRPAAPSDGLGNITAPIDCLDLEREASKYAERFHREEDDRFRIGCCSYRTRPATVVEAARAMCGGQEDLASDLLRMALADLEGVRRARVADPRR